MKSGFPENRTIFTHERIILIKDTLTTMHSNCNLLSKKNTTAIFNLADRQTDKQQDRQTDRQRGERAEKQTDGQTNGPKDTQTTELMSKETGEATDRKTHTSGRQTERQKNRPTHCTIIKKITLMNRELKTA